MVSAVSICSTLMLQEASTQVAQLGINDNATLWAGYDGRLVSMTYDESTSDLSSGSSDSLKRGHLHK